LASAQDRINVVEEVFVTGTEVVETRLAVGRAAESVFRNHDPREQQAIVFRGLDRPFTAALPRLTRSGAGRA
jgi:hypothetical protein